MDRAQLALLQSQPFWFSVQARASEEVGTLPKRFEELIAGGMRSEQAMSEVTLEGFIIQARNGLELVSDGGTLTAYVALLPVLAEMQRRKVSREARSVTKPDGMADEVWQFLTSREPGLAEVVYDPLGSEIIWFESELQQLVTQWEGKAYRRIADMGRSNIEPAAETSQTLSDPLPSSTAGDRNVAHPSDAWRATKVEKRARKGDLTLLQETGETTLKDSVSYDHARSYLGVSRRQVERLVSEKKGLTVIGGGHNKRITVSSLLAYLPPRKAT